MLAWRVLRRNPHLTEDVKKLAVLSAKYAFLLAIICHVLPPHYRPVCNALESLCSGQGTP